MNYYYSEECAKIRGLVEKMKDRAPIPKGSDKHRLLTALKVALNQTQGSEVLTQVEGVLQGFSGVGDHQLGCECYLCC